MTSRHRPARYAAFGRILKRTTPLTSSFKGCFLLQDAYTDAPRIKTTIFVFDLTIVVQHLPILLTFRTYYFVLDPGSQVRKNK